MKLSDSESVVCVTMHILPEDINGDAMVSVVGRFTPYIPFIPV